MRRWMRPYTTKEKARIIAGAVVSLIIVDDLSCLLYRISFSAISIGYIQRRT
jgi:hypothetical protein